MVTWDSVPKWLDAIKSVEWTSKERNNAGMTLHIVSDVGGLKQEWDAEMTEWVENEKGAWRTTGGNLTAVYYEALSPTKSGTKLTISLDYELPRSIFGRMVNKLRVQSTREGLR